MDLSIVEYAEMITLINEKHGRRNRYVRIDTDAYGHVTLRLESDLQVFEFLCEGSTAFSLLDEAGRTYPLFHKFINEKMKEDRCSVNSRRKYARVLCKFYAFIELMGYSEYALGLDELYELRSFMQGDGAGQCSNATVDEYLAIVRSFFDRMEIPCDALFYHRIVSNEIGSGLFAVKSGVPSYEISLPKNPHADERVPKYISMDNYVTLQEIARRDGDWNGIMLMHLMFRYGMRLGECLGLTEEDLVTFRICGKDVPTLIVRNRLSDKPWQHAKRKMIPLTKDDYAGKPYIEEWRDDDYSHYYLTESGEFVDALRKFIQTNRERAELNYPDNYRSCEADIVYPPAFTKKGLEKNHYIFVNRLGKPLSDQLWGKTLKKYFVEAGIPLDTVKKDKNLSHRFRHGFAMMHARFMDPPVQAQELQKMMHHRNLRYTMVYYNPTQEDEYLYKTEMQNKIYDNNPRLNAIISDFLKGGKDDEV